MYAAQQQVAVERAGTQMLTPGQVTVLAGASGVGKSIFALQLAAYAAAGRSWAGCRMDGCRVVYACLADSPDMVAACLRRIAEHADLPADAIEKNLVLLDGTDSMEPHLITFDATGRPIEGAALAELRTAAIGASLIVVDSASDAFDGDERIRPQVHAFMRMLSALAKHTGAAVLLLAYSEGSQASQRASMLAGNVKHRLSIEQTAEGPVLHGTGSAPLQLRWTDTGVLVPR